VIERIAHALVSIPGVYDLVQTIAGQRRMARRLRQTMATLPAGRMVDVGSAGGGMADRLGIEPVYVDIDVRPLLARRRRAVAARLVGADAARLPFSGESFEVAICLFVSHHLSDVEFRVVVGELARVTKGVLFFADAVRNEGRLLSRLLWRYDRGRNPRTKAEILAALGAAFEIAGASDFQAWHQYVLCVARPASRR
jgi:ubiquinone/menaquinone biosynthesis C-methylase UbiE